ncbi:MAG: isoprenylcysteine carboxyl methyltransferase family protein [Treponema sp.]
MYIIQSIVIAIFIIRLLFLKISKANEKNILANGGKEYGVKNSKRLTLLHILFYAVCLTESMLKTAAFDRMSMLGCILLVFSMIMLYIVTRLLKGIWTVKLMLVHNHQYNDHWLFRTVKHPNYFLNIAPELIGLALLCHALYTAIIILPFYAVVLYIRIKEENRLLQEVIIPNSMHSK